MSSKSDPKTKNVEIKDNKKPAKEKKDKRDDKQLKSEPKDLKSSQKDSSNSRSVVVSEPHPSTSNSVQTLNRSDSELSVVTLESLKYLQILDQYVSGKHWNFDTEYNLNVISGILWSLLINYFIFTDITDKCWDHLFVLLSISTIISVITCIELIVVSIVWYLSLIYHYINRSKICLTVIVIHIIIGSFNLLIAIIEFGTNTCYLSEKLDSSLEYMVPIKYEIKTTAIIHSIVSINLFLCALLLAIKRNDFKFYVLWRKGLLNEYLLLDDD